MDDIGPSHSCPKRPSGAAHVLGPDFQCVACGWIDEIASDFHKSEVRERAVQQARILYQNQVQATALQMLQMFMNQEMLRDLRTVVHEGTGRFEVSARLTELLDASIAGSIHFLNSIHKLSPSRSFVEQCVAQAFATPHLSFPVVPIARPEP